jgi:hypothetical protein
MKALAFIGYAAVVGRGRTGALEVFMAAAAVGRGAPVNTVSPVGGLKETEALSDAQWLSDGQAHRRRCRHDRTPHAMPLMTV